MSGSPLVVIRGSIGHWSCVQRRRPGGPKQILAEADALTGLAVRSVAKRPVNPVGVALATVLVSDADSPLRVGTEPGTLYAVVRLATAAMDSSPPQNGAAREA